MRNCRVLCWILFVVLVLQPFCGQVAAASVPEALLEDPSIASGVHSMDAHYALTDGDDLTVDAKAALLYEMNTGTMLYTINPDQKLYPASVTKIMTCLLALENGTLTDTITVSSEAVSSIDPDGSTVYLQSGEQMTLENLLYCMMVSSGNDAAAVIAEYVSGSQDAFIALMNQRAQELGCTNTHFANPHGLHDENHYTTARDLGKIMLAALEKPMFQTLYATAQYDVPATNMSDVRSLESTNYFINTSRTEGYYDQRVVGGKTGFTTPAGRCLVCTAEDGDLNLLSVVLGGENIYQGDGVTVQAYGNFVQTEKLLDYGFSNFTLVDAISESQTVGQFSVTGGANETVGHPAQTVQVALPVDYKMEDLRWDYVRNDQELTAPMEAETELGTVCAWYQDYCLSQTALLSVNPVEPVSESASQLQQNAQNQEPTKQEKTWKDYAIVAALFVGGLVAVFLLLTVVLAICNSVRRAKHRRRRRDRRRSR